MTTTYRVYVCMFVPLYAYTCSYLCSPFLPPIQSNSPDAPPTDNHVGVHQLRKFPFLRRGEGIARFGMNKIKLKPKKSPKQSSKPLPSSNKQKSPPKSSKPLSSVHNQRSPPKPTKFLALSGEQYCGASLDALADSQPPLLQSERQPKVRKVARGRSEDGLTSNAKSIQVSTL